ncbi:MAG: hypothetical protein IT430_11190 [Phycisphaerales bacterium]|nr:hypothetical protein [Phycisphaerales bacterium]
MKHYRRTCLALAASALVAPASAPGAQDAPDSPLNFGAPPDQTQTGNEDDQPIFDFGLEGGDDGGLEFGEPQPLDNPQAQPGAAAGAQPQGDTELLSLNGMPIDQAMLLLQRLSGRPVQPDPLMLSQQGKITIINSTPLTREQALNLLVDTLFASRIAVIDRGTHLAVLNVANIQEGMVPVWGPEKPVLGRNDTGMVIEKVFEIKYGKASTIKDKIQAQGPPNMKIEVDDTSNRIIALYNIGTLQRLQEQIDKLDIAGSNLQLETFYLKYASADRVAKLIVGIFGQEEEQQQGGRNQNIFGGNRPRPGQDEGLTTSTQLSVVTDKSLNSVTVRAERDIIEQVRNQIKDQWDIKHGEPLPIVIRLENSDAVKMAEMLNEIFAQESEDVQTFESGFFFDGNAARQQQNTSRNQEGEGPKLSALAGQLSFKADNTKNLLFVTSQIPTMYPLVEEFIHRLDVPGDVNKPQIYELKYADAEDLAIRINALLAEEGARGAAVERTTQELTERSNVSQIGNQQQQTQQQTPEQGQEMAFPWQSGSPDPDARKISNLIGQVRVMPYPRMNGLMVIAPPELREAMGTLIEMLDAPGRQVLIQAIVAEVSVDDATSLGIRWGSGNVASGPNEDNRIVVNSNIEGEKNELINALFDTSTLGVNVDLNVALQALSQVTDVNVLFRPKVVTSDNEEANFFDGQDIPFITDSTTTDVGGVTQSFEYLAVGIQLSVRPHITVEGNVDLRVNLKLSSVVPGQTLFGGSILDRRETTTKVTIRDGQTVVISGIRRTVLNDIVRKVPLLGDIPLIGGLFRSTEKSESRTELVAFIRPIILDSDDKIRSLGEDDYRLLNESRRKLEGADVEESPASLDHWNEPYYREREPQPEGDPLDDGRGSLPWMQTPSGAADREDKPRSGAKFSLAERKSDLPWEQPPKD